MLKVLIVEDEELAAMRLKSLLEEVQLEMEVVARTESVVESVGWLNQNEVDLIFLDIHLSDGLSFQIFDQLSIKTPVIFTTAYDQYAIKAFQKNGIGYLLKPFEKKDLEEALDKFQLYFKSGQVDYQALATAIKGEAPSYQKRFLVYAGNKIQTIAASNVAYFMADQKVVFLYAASGKRFMVDFSLDKLESLLDPEHFFRINRQFILNIQSIRNMYAYSKGRVKIDLEPASPKEAIVSVERSPRFKSWLNQ